jgi:hypothetical protein
MLPHELKSSTVTGFSYENGSVDLKLLIEPEGTEFYDLRLLTAKLEPCDLERMEHVQMEEEDGEVIHIGYSNTELEIIIEWNKFSNPQKSTQKFYKFTGRKIVLNKVPN